MSNWTIITVDDLKATGLGFVVDKAQTTATGGTSPVAYAIETATARIRRCIAGGGNKLDVNPEKVPNSLLAVGANIAMWGLMQRLRVPLSEDQKKQRDLDEADLKRVADPKISTPLETPDDPAGTAEMETPTPGPRIIPRVNRQFTHYTEDGA
jgi:hypothetical protein